MNVIKDGGPAFPIPIAGCNDGCVYNTLQQSSGEFGGMTLRDYFAAKVMQSFMHGAVLPPGFDAIEQIAFVADRAFEVADAMLAAREKKS